MDVCKPSPEFMCAGRRTRRIELMRIVFSLLLAEIAGGVTPPQHPVFAPAPPPPVVVNFKQAPEPSLLLAAAGDLLWVVDRAAKTLVAWDRQAKTARRLSLPDLGEGSELPRPLLLSAFPGGLWLWDVAGERGFVWVEQSWRGPFPFPGKVASMTALEDGSAVLNTPAHPAGSFAVLDLTGTLKARFGSPPVVKIKELATYYDS